MEIATPGCMHVSRGSAVVKRRYGMWEYDGETGIVRTSHGVAATALNNRHENRSIRPSLS